MTTYFLDSSAIVKRYVNERGSSWINALLKPSAGNRFYIARITGAEVVAAITRRARGGSISLADAALGISDFRYDFTYAFNFIEMDVRLISSAMSLAELHPLRGYDAVQLAAVIQASDIRRANVLPPLVLISADIELLNAAQVEGLLTDNPNNH